MSNNSSLKSEPVTNKKLRIVRTSILILLCSIILVGASLYAKQYTYFFSKIFINNDQKIATEIARIKAEGKNKEFVFIAVPNALQMITLPNPPDTNDLDASTYLKLKPTEPIPSEVVQNDVVFNFSFNGITYINYLNTMKNPDEIYRITDELHHLTLSLNKKFNRPPLKNRIPEVVQMAPLDQIMAGEEALSVYPSIRAVDAYVAAEIMSRINKDSKDTYTQVAQAIVDRGIGYGLYGKSDADAAKSIVTQYFSLYDLNLNKNASTTIKSQVNNSH